MRKGVFELSSHDSARMISRIMDVSGLVLKPPIEVVTDTTDFVRIYRGQVIRLQDRDFLVRGDVYEPRFGLKEDPKMWVKRCYALESGLKVIIKLGFREEFETTIGSLSIPCFRSPEKEAEVLWLVRGDERFMQGETFLDDSGNSVRVIEFIDGNTLYGEIYEMEIDHEEYYHTRLAPILEKVIGSCEAIQMLHNHHFYHGDIRNDHIIIDNATGSFRWIDFDLCQSYEPYDLWRLGNILQFVVGKGLNPIQQIRQKKLFPPDVISSLKPSDAGAVYGYRLMNLKKLYPYISYRLNAILMRFSAGSADNYQTILELVNDLGEAVRELSSA